MSVSVRRIDLDMKRQEISLAEIQRAREELLSRVVEFFSEQHGVIGLLLVGSIPNGSADAYSDIDLRVFTTPESHVDFVKKRLEIPLQWGDLLFNEWTNGTDVCVSHFRPFLKVDVIYLNVDEVKPSSWFSLPSETLLDHDEVLMNFLARCAAAEFERPTNNEISRTTSKALACAHESLRRSRRGELFYAQSLLERVRAYIIQIEDWIAKFEPEDAADLKLEKRISQRLQSVLNEAYPPLDAGKIEGSLVAVCTLLSDQIVDLHSSYSLDRELEKDVAAVELILQQQIADSAMG